jgi:hypothetical protein
MRKFVGAFSEGLWGRKNVFNACSGLPTIKNNYLKMLEFANKIF